MVEHPDRLEAQGFGLAGALDRVRPGVDGVPAVVLALPSLGDHHPDVHACPCLAFWWAARRSSRLGAPGAAAYHRHHGDAAAVRPPGDSPSGPQGRLSGPSEPWAFLPQPARRRWGPPWLDDRDDRGRAGARRAGARGAWAWSGAARACPAWAPAWRYRPRDGRRPSVDGDPGHAGEGGAGRRDRLRHQRARRAGVCGDRRRSGRPGRDPGRRPAGERHGPPGLRGIARHRSGAAWSSGSATRAERVRRSRPWMRRQRPGAPDGGGSRSPPALAAIGRFGIVLATGEIDRSWCHTIGYLSPILAAVAVGAALLTGEPADAAPGVTVRALGLDSRAWRRGRAGGRGAHRRGALAGDAAR